MIHLSDTSTRAHFNGSNSSSHIRLEDFFTLCASNHYQMFARAFAYVFGAGQGNQNRSAVMCHRVRQQPAGTTFGVELTAVSHTERRSGDKG